MRKCISGVWGLTAPLIDNAYYATRPNYGAMERLMDDKILEAAYKLVQAQLTESRAACDELRCKMLDAENELAPLLDPTVASIVAAYLRQHGYDGLYCPHSDCACSIDDLIPCCGAGDARCVPGYRVPCDCGDHDFHIVPERPTGGSDE